jgi:hypothetical protein
MTTYYLSGPMRGKPNYNYDTFFAVEAALYEAFSEAARTWTPEGANVIFNPARQFGGDQDLPATEYMAVDLVNVCDSDVIVLLPGWESSEGSEHEVTLGKWLDKRFMLAEPIEAADGWRFTTLSEPPARELSPRAGVLNEARALITGDRNNAYGPPTQDFSRTAGALNAYGYRGADGRELAAHDIAIFVMAVKMSRLMWTPGRRDSWVDIAGYSGCGYECAVEEAKT